MSAKPPASAAEWFALADAREAAEDWEAAVNAYDEGLRLEPNAVAPAANRARVLVDELGRPQEALDAIEAFLKDRPGDEWAQFTRARALVELGRMDEATVAYLALAKRVGSIDDEVGFRVLVNAGDCLAKTRPPLEALVMSERALSMRIDDGDSWYNRGCHLTFAQEPARAIGSLRLGFVLNPTLVAHAKDDAELDPLRTLPEYLRISSPKAVMSPTHAQELVRKIWLEVDAWRAFVDAPLTKALDIAADEWVEVSAKKNKS